MKGAFLDIQNFASNAGLTIRLELAPKGPWSAEFTAGYSCSSSIWLKETGQPPAVCDVAPTIALRELALLCRGKTLVVNNLGHREIPVPANLTD